jgi:hypothetical protein
VSEHRETGEREGFKGKKILMARSHEFTDTH